MAPLLLAYLICLGGELFADIPKPLQGVIALEKFEVPVDTPLEKLGWKGGNQKARKPDHFLVSEGGKVFLKSRYILGTEANYLFKEVEWEIGTHPWLRWKWRVQKLPAGAKILEPKASDAPAQVYILWKNYLSHFVIKYFWATSDPVGTVLRQSRLLVGELFGTVLRSGGPVNVWQTEIRNVSEDFKKNFERDAPGNPRGIAVLSDGDETQSESEADYSNFEVLATAPVL
jgi:hypothetical protein